MPVVLRISKQTLDFKVFIKNISLHLNMITSKNVIMLKHYYCSNKYLKDLIVCSNYFKKSPDFIIQLINIEPLHSDLTLLFQKINKNINILIKNMSK